MNRHFPDHERRDPGEGPREIDEQTLRRLLHGAVEDIEPADGALEHLQRAVPVRRTRRRQAVAGAVAAVVLGATALPALIHAATTADTTDDHQANAASSHQRPHGGGTEGEHGRGLPAPGPLNPSTSPDAGRRDGHRKEEDEAQRKDGSTTGPTGSATAAGPDLRPTLAATSPTCDRNQLGKGSGAVGAPDKNGRVYGSFRVVNVSGSVCTVAGEGVVAAHSAGGSENSRITVVNHTAGDAATGLPDPATEPSQVILQPGQAYEIRFAFVPAPDGGPSGCAKPGITTPTPASDSGSASAAPPAVAAEKPQVQDASSPTQPPSGVVLSHTPDVGEPKAADAALPDACAGTVYRTGALAAAPTA
ncbi:hypothetical protein LKL35_04720 [Streptomyces sp. ET3-23]|uniref:hypothetical protein n=1 Tax=Streptomyces sp. ET3-23 TaxID=2885643 RepID=UPI001D101C08|nr:hypothetical protein [Streptomyces sp. ET3-23]MCC2274745.1 hypothetical protein [Streptomyces sp. ET3-23]